LPSPSPKVVAATTREPADATTVKDGKEDADAIYKAESKRKRTSRVIIRNLSFHATERHVRSAMEASFGPVASIDLPTVPVLPSEDVDNKKDDGGKGKQRRPLVLPRHRGFAFVTFASAADARKAVAGSSGEGGAEVKIKNRPVAIDFSVSKMEHRRIAKEGEEKREEEDKSDSESVAEEEEVEGGECKDEDDEEVGSEDEDDGSDSDSDGDDDDDDEEEDDGDGKSEAEDVEDDDATAAPAREHDPTEARRTLFLRNVPFDATRHDVFDLFRKFGRVEAAYLVKERETGVFRGTAFVRFETEGACASAMAAASSSEGGDDEGGGGQFVSGKNIAMGLGAGGGGGDPSSSSSSGLLLKGRAILVDLAVDRTTASSLAVRRDDDGKPMKKMVGKDKRNLYLKNEGRVSSAAESADAREASARHGGTWEDLPPGDRAKRERAFADKSTKLRSPLFFINPHRISIRNLAKHVDEAGLKRLVFGALKEGLKEGLATPKDAVAHWRAGGELAHSEVMRRATDPSLVTPPLDEKNMRGSVASVFIDRDYSGGKKAADAPSRGFGFVEFAHHTHALAALRQLNNNPAYSAEYAAGGKHASEMAKQRGGKKAKVDPETGLEFLNEDGKASVPRLIVELAVSYLTVCTMQRVPICHFYLPALNCIHVELD
jgi:nucleolar protein 4